MRNKLINGVKILCLALAVCFLAALLPVSSAGASVPIDTAHDVSLTIHFIHEGLPISNAYFAIYRVADVSAGGTYTLTEQFSRYPVHLSISDSSSWQLAAGTLSGYVRRDQLSPTASGFTDADGNLTFSASLTPGLYLVLGESTQVGNVTYTPKPFLVMLPSVNYENGGWDYNVDVRPKYHYDDPDKDPTVTRKVLKIWNDAGHEEERPSEIVVQLLRDGEVYQTVTLTAENNWRFTWEGLSSSYDWQVVEQEPSGYTVTVWQEGITFVVTNSYIPKSPEPTPAPIPTPTPSEPPVPSSPVPSEPVSSLPPSPAPSTSPDDPQLPQTGQVWWPVPVLLAAGLLFLLIGLLRRRGADYDA